MVIMVTLEASFKQFVRGGCFIATEEEFLPKKNNMMPLTIFVNICEKCVRSYKLQEATSKFLIIS